MTDSLSWMRARLQQLEAGGWDRVPGHAEEATRLRRDITREERAMSEATRNVNTGMPIWDLLGPLRDWPLFDLQTVRPGGEVEYVWNEPPIPGAEQWQLLREAMARLEAAGMVVTFYNLPGQSPRLKVRPLAPGETREEDEDEVLPWHRQCAVCGDEGRAVEVTMPGVDYQFQCVTDPAHDQWGVTQDQIDQAEMEANPAAAGEPRDSTHALFHRLEIPATIRLTNAGTVILVDLPGRRVLTMADGGTDSWDWTLEQTGRNAHLIGDGFGLTADAMLATAHRLYRGE